MPSRPAPRRPEPERPDAESAPPRPKFRHLAPVEETPGEVLRHGHGSGCIPVILIHFSLLALLIWLAVLIGGFVLSGRLDHRAAPAAAAPAQRR
jgi:hypothetical protein